MNVMKQGALFVRANLWIVPLVALLLWVLFRFLDPAPPRTLVMTTGPENGSYHQLGLELQERLAREGLRLELRPSRGSLDNLQRLVGAGSEVQLGLVQSGTSLLLEPAQRRRLSALAALYREPLWLFQRSEFEVQRLTDLDGMRVAVGSEGSGTRAVVASLFAEMDTFPDRQEEAFQDWQTMSHTAAVNALRNGELDAAFFVLPVDNPLLRQLISDSELRLVNLRESRALAARLPFLEHLVLVEGLLDIGASIPAQDTSLLAPVATLVVNDGFHPALTSLVLEAARDVLRDGSLLDRPGDFPATGPLELELTAEADYYHREGVPFLQRYLPFWFASIVDRYIVLLIPFIVIMLPLLRSMGPIYAWRMRARVFRWYEHLRRIDRLILSGEIEACLDQEISSLQKLEADLSRVDVPLSYAHELYSLHLHVRYMVKRLEAMRDGRSEMLEQKPVNG
ncbi:TAXI family TRAP transporter solute-binding subunit [Pseudomonas sp.]|uniref:TAXI family TRAP transporter solute-binding subunit n=1 Tax=Pseudomonas sp. TaxID=306 RepID=UPI002729D80C|nr:TAXI family TRAP transporter solute-binding subunit [Pseudomonas sp.]